MAERKWTHAQADAIHARGGTLLVSAAAGSGKTAVLVQRVLERMTDEQNPSDADRLLVVTFTKAAAAEMRERIAQQLSRMLAEDPSNTALQRQQILLGGAHISTVHSFCSELVRENFYKLNISHDFRIADDGEMSILRGEAITQVLEDCYAAENPDFYELVEAFSSDRDDNRLILSVNQLYNFIRSHPFPERWLREKSEMYSGSVPVEETPWGLCLLHFAREACDYSLSLIRDSLESMQADEKLCAAYTEAYQSDLAGLTALQRAAQNGEWDNVGELAANFVFTRLKAVRGYAEDPLKLRLTACRDEVKSTVKKLAALFSATAQDCTNDLQALSPIVEQLFHVVTAFSHTLDQMKAERRLADFGDLEHWALRLLVRETENGYERTEEAIELSRRFDEIMVDEYQDTNEAQDLLFRAISQNEENLFMVGDVKQSIYSFRQAMPRIFLQRRSEFAEYDRENSRYPACIVLDQNFRSRSTVTDSVNFVFGQLMSSQAGDVEYSGKELLVAGASYPPQELCDTRLDILDLSMGQGSEDAMELLESRHIAETILQLIAQGLQVTENGVQRKAVFRDFCILLRSANQYAAKYAKELQLCGVPAWADSSSGFFEAPEISSVLSLLRVVDNPVQDIPLLSVLMSPIYGFTPDELSAVRLHLPKAPLYLALCEAAKQGDARAAKVLEELDSLRSLAATLPSDRLLHSIYQKTGYLTLVQAMTNGEQRLSNLQLLMEYAKKYEASGYNGLSGFIRFIDRLQEQNSDLPGASTISEASNVVRIMSIHKSKGLEFPVCILAGCARRFNKERGDALLHPELGLGIKRKEQGGLARVTTLPREAIALEQERQSMSEELRVLYVAMTRAREKLIMLTTVKDLNSTLASIAPKLTAEERISPYVVRSASSISDWLLSCALRHPSGGALRDRALCSGELIADCVGAPWEIRVLPAPLVEEESAQADSAVVMPPPDEALLSRIAGEIDFIYPDASLFGVPAKVSASELAAESAGEDYEILSRPAFLGKSGLTPAERGTALHQYMQFANYAAAAEHPEKELERLQIGGFLSEEEAAAVQLKRVTAFFQSSIAKRMLAAEICHREFRFTVEIPASLLKKEVPAEQQVILQGAVDCVFVEPDGAVIIDYKTDRTSSPEELWSRYRVQLALYKMAIERVLEVPVKECALYSFALGQVVTGDLSFVGEKIYEL